jgi:hypothetical protein
MNSSKKFNSAHKTIRKNDSEKKKSPGNTIIFFNIKNNYFLQKE